MPATAAQLQAYIDNANGFETHYQGKLKPCLLNFRGKHKRNMGLFWPKKWVRADGDISGSRTSAHRPEADTMIASGANRWSLSG